MISMSRLGLYVLGFLALVSACAAGRHAASQPASRGHTTVRNTHTRPASGGLPRPVGDPLLTRQASLVGHVHGMVGGYTSLIVGTDASRTEPRGVARSLIALAGIGHLQVSCSRTPRGRFI